jgi:hypothetical protein
LGSDRASSPPSLILRLLIGASLALIIALSLIALAVDRGFRGAAEGAQQ